jgi:cholesterol transport system auxiliary component
MIKQILIVIACFIVSSCSLFSPINVKQSNQYVLNKLPNLPPQSRHRTTILIAPPMTRPIYNTTQMIYTDKQYQVKYYVKNEWAETPSQMLKLLLVQSLQKTHYFRSVVTLPYSGEYDYVLNTTILDFQQDFTAEQPMMKILVDVKLVRASNNRLIASTHFSLAAPMSHASPYAGVIASNQAVAVLLNRIALFCFDNLSH